LKPTTKLLLIFFLFLMTGCIKDDNPVPKVPVNFYIYPNEIGYYNLNWAGGSEYFTGGVQGIVVFRIDDWSFSAFDRACPHDWDYEDSWLWVEPDGLTVKCTRCGSIYNLLDGGQITGPSQYPLRPYFTKYDGMRLRVHS
jgi:nitrite reductase/ring-hydroxylating ferredoxin subunit